MTISGELLETRDESCLPLECRKHGDGRSLSLEQSFSSDRDPWVLRVPPVPDPCLCLLPAIVSAIPKLCDLEYSSFLLFFFYFRLLCWWKDLQVRSLALLQAVHPCALLTDVLSTAFPHHTRASQPPSTQSSAFKVNWLPPAAHARCCNSAPTVAPYSFSHICHISRIGKLGPPTSTTVWATSSGISLLRVSS